MLYQRDALIEGSTSAIDVMLTTNLTTYYTNKQPINWLGISLHRVFCCTTAIGYNPIWAKIGITSRFNPIEFLSVSYKMNNIMVYSVYLLFYHVLELSSPIKPIKYSTGKLTPFSL